MWEILFVKSATFGAQGILLPMLATHKFRTNILTEIV